MQNHVHVIKSLKNQLCSKDYKMYPNRGFPLSQWASLYLNWHWCYPDTIGFIEAEINITTQICPSLWKRVRILFFTVSSKKKMEVKAILVWGQGQIFEKIWSLIKMGGKPFSGGGNLFIKIKFVTDWTHKSTCTCGWVGSLVRK